MEIKNKINKATKSMGDNSLIATLMTVTTLLVAIGVVLGRLWWADVRFNNKVLDKKNQVNTTLEQNVEALPTLQENFKQLESVGPKPEQVLDALPTNPEFSSFAKELEAVASLAGAQLVSVVNIDGETTQTTAGGSPNLTPVTMGIQLSVIGNYQELTKFISLIELSTRPVQISQLTYTGAEPQVTLAVSLSTWWQSSTVVGNDKEVVQE